MNEKCSLALENFVQEAKRTSEFLASLKEYPAPFQERKKISEQRSKENAAYNIYLRLRFELCRKAAPPL